MVTFLRLFLNADCESTAFMTYHKGGSACGKIPYDLTSSEARPCQQSNRYELRMSALHSILYELRELYDRTQPFLAIVCEI